MCLPGYNNLTLANNSLINHANYHTTSSSIRQNNARIRTNDTENNNNNNYGRHVNSTNFSNGSSSSSTHNTATTATAPISNHISTNNLNSNANIGSLNALNSPSSLYSDNFYPSHAIHDSASLNGFPNTPSTWSAAEQPFDSIDNSDLNFSTGTKNENDVGNDVTGLSLPVMAAYPSSDSFMEHASFIESSAPCELPASNATRSSFRRRNSTQHSTSIATSTSAPELTESCHATPIVENVKMKKKRIRIRKDKEKHNLSEVRRRSELRERFFKLQAAVGCEQKDRASIISNAVTKIKEQEALIEQLQEFKLSVSSANRIQVKPEETASSGLGIAKMEAPKVSELPVSLLDVLCGDYINPSSANVTMPPNFIESLSSFSPSSSPLLESIPTVCISPTGMFLDSNLSFVMLFQLSHPSFPSSQVPPKCVSPPSHMIAICPPPQSLHMNTIYTVTHPQDVCKAHSSLQQILAAVQQSTFVSPVRWKQTCITSVGNLIDVEIILSPVFHNNNFRFCSAFILPVLEQDHETNLDSIHSFLRLNSQNSLPSSTLSPSSSSSAQTSEFFYEY